MSAKALHLNLLNPQERRSSAPVRARILLPVIAGICLAFILGWGTLLGVQLAFVSSRADALKSQIADLTSEYTLVTTLKARYRDLQAEADQFCFYRNGRVARGEVFRRLAYAIPEGITLTALSVPAPDDQNLRPPAGSTQRAQQGPSNATERVCLRLTGLAATEQDVFQLLNTLKGDSFTNLVVIAEHAAKPADESPRVLAFRQDAPTDRRGKNSVYFDVIYALKPREFAK